MNAKATKMKKVNRAVRNASWKGRLPAKKCFLYSSKVIRKAPKAARKPKIAPIKTKRRGLNTAVIDIYQVLGVNW